MPKKKSKPTPKRKGFPKEELLKIRKTLIADRAKLLDELGSISDESLKKSAKDASGDLSGYSFHMADMATDLYDREFLLGLAEGERKRLQDLGDALKRIDDGSYGICDMCGDRISKERLRAMPQAQYCIKCQEQTEKRGG